MAVRESNVESATSLTSDAPGVLPACERSCLAKGTSSWVDEIIGQQAAHEVDALLAAAIKDFARVQAIDAISRNAMASQEPTALCTTLELLERPVEVARHRPLTEAELRQQWGWYSEGEDSEEERLRECWARITMRSTKELASSHELASGQDKTNAMKTHDVPSVQAQAVPQAAGASNTPERRVVRSTHHGSASQFALGLRKTATGRSDSNQPDKTLKPRVRHSPKTFSICVETEHFQLSTPPTSPAAQVARSCTLLPSVDGAIPFSKKSSIGTARPRKWTSAVRAKRPGVKGEFSSRCHEIF